MSHTSTEPGPPANAQIMTTVKHCARSPATTLHVHVAWTRHGKTTFYTNIHLCAYIKKQTKSFLLNITLTFVNIHDHRIINQKILVFSTS